MSGNPAQESSRWQQQDLLAALQSAQAAAPAEAEPHPSTRSPDPSPDPSPDQAPDQPPDRQVDQSTSRSAARSAVNPAARGAAPAPRTLLILDTETTGLDPERDHCLEVGAILFHVVDRAVLSQVSFLLPVDSNPAEPINGIAAATTRRPQPWRQGLDFFRSMADQADAAVAHNAAFDREWFGRGQLPSLPLPWICSMDDIRWPEDRRLRPRPSVRDLALAYGVPVWAAHRALTDCTYLAEVFQRCSDLESLLIAAQEPRQLFRAQLAYAERHQAKQAGFRWNDPVQGAWTRRLSEREAAALPFPVQPVASHPGTQAA